MNLMVVESESKKECRAFEWANENVQDFGICWLPPGAPISVPWRSVKLQGSSTMDVKQQIQPMLEAVAFCYTFVQVWLCGLA